MSTTRRAIDKGRRGFLALLPAAPFGAAAAAKEAAASMGLVGPIGASSSMAGLVGGGALQSCIPSASNEHWIVEALRSFNSPERIKNDMEFAKSAARVLDPDIAALRSVSPSQAYQMQVQRVFKARREHEKNCLKREFDEWAKHNPGAALAAKLFD